MIRNYNGKVNRALIRDLRKLCGVNAENERNLFEVFDKNGEVSVYENLDFFGCPDEMSTVVTLKTETEVKKYLKKDFAKRVDGYLSHKEPDKDFFLNALIEFVKANARFPERDAMRQMEKDAESKRVAELHTSNECVKKEITIQDIALEILELAEEIMESRRENNPKDIDTPVEPYPERLWIETDEFQGSILYAKYYGYKDFRDYSCAIRFKGYRDVKTITIGYCSDGTPVIRAEDFFEKKLDVSITEYLIIIHKSIVEMAKKTDFEFESEIDYQKFSS